MNELFLKLLDSEPITWENRAHFFAVAAGQLRRILVNHARERHAQKRGVSDPRVQHLLELDEAIERRKRPKHSASPLPH